MKSFLFLLLLVINLEVFANPIFKRNLVTGIDFNNDGLFDRDVYNCITSDIYDGNTAVSFWGDSRLDLVDVPIYGHSSLDVYLGANGWNVQNFGVGGRQSRGLNDEITECFKRETDYIPERLDSNGVWIGGGDPLKPYYTNFITSKNVAFEIGGNDFVGNALFIYIFPPFMINFLDRANDEIYYTVKKLRIKERNVLLIGNYSAISWSLKIGNPHIYGFPYFNPKVIEAMVNESTWKKDTMDGLTPILKRILVGIPPFMLVPVGDLFSGSIFTHFAIAGNSQLDAIIQSGQDRINAQIENLAVGSYEWWLRICQQAPGTIPALGVMFLEPRLAGIVANETAFAPEYYAGTNMHYLSTFQYFLHPKTPLEPYVVNQELMTDIIHKNHIGYLVWGKVVGDKIRGLNWHENRSIGNSTFSNSVQMNLMVALAKIKAKYQARLALLNSQQTGKSALINERVNTIDRRISEIQELERQRLEEERLVREAAEREAAILAATEAQRRADALRRQEEERRIQAEEAAVRAQRDLEQLGLLFACFAFGACG